MTRNTIGRCAECGSTYGEDKCIQCTICGTEPYVACPHCPPSAMHGG